MCLWSAVSLVVCGCTVWRGYWGLGDWTALDLRNRGYLSMDI